MTSNLQINNIDYKQFAKTFFVSIVLMIMLITNLDDINNADDKQAIGKNT